MSAEVYSFFCMNEMLDIFLQVLLLFLLVDTEEFPGMS